MVVLSGIGVQGASASADCPNDDQAPTASTMDQAATALVCDINLVRAQHGLQTLTSNWRLARAAQGLADDEAANHYVGHVDSRNRTAFDRIGLTGYFTPADDLLLLENVDWGAGDRIAPAATIDGWMNSTDHRRNLLNPDIRNVGIGIAQGTVPQEPGMQGVFYVADFGAVSGKSAMTTSTGSTSTSKSTSTKTKRCTRKRVRRSRKHPHKRRYRLVCTSRAR